MAFDPNRPVNATQIVAAELRDQFNALNDKIDAVPAGQDGTNGLDGAPGEVSLAQLFNERALHARNPTGIGPLGITVSDPPTQAEMQAIATRQDEILLLLQRQP